MRLLGRNKLSNLKEGAEDTAHKWLSAWVSEVAHAHWGCASDVLQQYPKVSELGNGIFQFQIGDTDLLMKVQISFRHRMVFIKELHK